jgi:uncharacterized protein (TIGR03435 family)
MRPKAGCLMVMMLLWVTPNGLQAQDAAAGNGATKPLMMAKDADPDWNVVSVKPSDPNAKRVRIDIEGRHVVVENEPVWMMLRLAYGVQASQIVGVPEWVKTERWDADGVPDLDGQPDVKQLQSMVRKLLAERFGLKLHHEQREMPVFALTVTKGGPKLMIKSTGDPNGLPNRDARPGDGGWRNKFTNTSMPDLALMLMLYVDRPVVDKTGLQGRYDFQLGWTADETQATTDSSLPPGLFTAIQEQLGLKLEPVKAMADVLVIDKVERPGAN